MKVKLDENMPAPMAALFRQAGHDVATVTEQGMSGSEDPEVLRAATTEQRVLVTFDTDFGNVRNYPLGTHVGVVVFRLHDQRWAVLERPARRVLESRLLDRLGGGLAVVDETRIRLRAATKTEESP